MGKKDHLTLHNKETARVEAVLQLIRKQTPLTEKFCNYACVKRFLKAKGDNVKKAAKQLRACLQWRESIVTDHLIADDFSAELAEGLAYVAGHDDESRPVMIFRMKQDYQKLHSQKLLTRLVVFTMEVAISTMPKNVEQFVMLFDARQAMNGNSVRITGRQDLRGTQKVSGVPLRCHRPSLQLMAMLGKGFYRSASAFMNLLLPALKIVAEYYPGRLCKAFVIDPPSLFAYLWKGVRPFVELSACTTIVSSLDFEESLDFNDFSAYPRASSLRFDPSTVKSTAKIGSCSSSRFSFTVSHHLDSLKPWYLSLTDTSASKVGPTSPSPALISPLNARSLSFASPVARTPRGPPASRKGLFPSTPLPQRVTAPPRTPFLQSPATFFRRDSGKVERCRESFLPYVKFQRRPYDEMVYRSKMRPPLGGLISIVSPHLRRRHISVSQRVYKNKKRRRARRGVKRRAVCWRFNEWHGKKGAWSKRRMKNTLEMFIMVPSRMNE
ncbi:CRAL/TRIO, N-terminal domain superfamily [Sesbania bispinosa]|nr:CRAL/TRIO, N-terminal domain superfamily [Sesbania bispinosa]